MTDQKWLYFDPGDDADNAFPLYYASLGGFYDVAEHLVARHPEHVDARGGLMVTPLVAALCGNTSRSPSCCIGMVRTSMFATMIKTRHNARHTGLEF